ncbi:MAG: recombinase family protein [Anaerolineales bacterium]|uniref:recombinase family protein n=1 Tax=Candidatus Villigracilis vicinus TaxID=3140679 RepID=UPI0031357F8A|nr:recombinase family protein [Anaerolineales bacterium]
MNWILFSLLKVGREVMSERKLGNVPCEERAKARTGRVIGSRAPYGYDHVRDENGKIVNFEPLDEEAKIVKLIYEWYVNGDESGQRLSAGRIAKRLSAMCIPTPGETNPGYHRTRGSGMWHAYAVLSIIERETYAEFGDLESALVQHAMSVQKKNGLKLRFLH